MSVRDYAFITFVVVFIMVSLAIHEQLCSIANSLKVVASPPQIEFIISPQKE